jgi:hypothetical protein
LLRLRLSRGSGPDGRRGPLLAAAAGPQIEDRGEDGEYRQDDVEDQAIFI